MRDGFKYRLEQASAYKAWKPGQYEDYADLTGSDPQIASALAGLEARVHLVDDINPALAANQTVGAVAAFERLE